MAIDFPSSPALNDTFTSGVLTWQWNGTAWVPYVGAVSGGLPSGTICPFYQSSAPVGWTQLTTQNDKLLRIVNTTSAGSAGGSNAFSTINAATATGAHTLAASEIPNFTIGGTVTVYPNGNSGYYFPMAPNQGWGYGVWNDGTGAGTVYWIYGSNVNPSITYTNSFSNSVSMTSSNTGGGGHTHPVTMNIAYCDLILASKN